MRQAGKVATDIREETLKTSSLLGPKFAVNAFAIPARQQIRSRAGLDDVEKIL
jgi:hypothetical protein